MIIMAEWYSGNHGGLKIADICLTGEEKTPNKPHPGNLSRPGIEPRWAWYRLLLRWTLLRMDRCGRFPLLSAPHSLFSIWTDLKRSEKIPVAPAWRWGEWIWLTGPSTLDRNSPQGLNISSIMVFDQIRDQEIPITFRSHILYKL